MRVKKKLEYLEEEKERKAARQRVRDQRKQEEARRKMVVELAKKKYTYDYDGQIMIRNQRQRLNASLLKEISYTAEIPKSYEFPGQEVAIIRRPRQQRSTESRNEDAVSQASKARYPTAIKRLLSPSLDAYNNGGQRQVSNIPFIKLRDGVTLREHTKAGEQVLTGQPGNQVTTSRQSASALASRSTSSCRC